MEDMNIESMYEREDVRQLVHAISLLEDERDVEAFLTDLCTPREICDFARSASSAPAAHRSACGKDRSAWMKSR